jgi:6-phosphogluconolactonase (cycloisomerase 2 family)
VRAIPAPNSQVQQEINQRMSKRFAWLFGVMVLVAIGLLVACSNSYNSSNDGLVLVGSQGSGLIQTYTFGLSNGQVSSIANPTSDTAQLVCVLNGIPSSIVIDPAGAYAYVIINQNSDCPGSATGIGAFKINSSGTLTPVGSLIPDPTPVALFMDPSGKFLFAAEGLSATVNSYAIGSGASLTAVQGTFTLPPMIQAPNFSALAATPTVLPPLVDGVQVATCSSPGNNALTSEYLYVTDSVNYVVLEFSVDTSTGALGNPPNHTEVPTFQAGAVPSGVTVDPCNRFVYVSNTMANTVSAYAICNGGPTSPTSPTQPQPCPTVPDGSIVSVSGSPFSLSGGANGPVPLVVDPFGKNLYVLETLSNQVSTFHISAVSGSLTAGTPAVVATGLEPTSIAIRADDNWLFVSNFNSATLSQYAVTPDTGQLAPLEPVITDNFPWGVAVK